MLARRIAQLAGSKSALSRSSSSCTRTGLSKTGLVNRAISLYAFVVTERLSSERDSITRNRQTGKGATNSALSLRSCYRKPKISSSDLDVVAIGPRTDHHSWFLPDPVVELACSRPCR